MSDDNNEGFEIAYAEYIDITNRLSEGVDSLTLAAVMTTIGLSIYRTVLSEGDYDKMIEAIIEFKDEINTLETSKGYLN